MSKRKFRILSIDGGGIRGVVPLKVLQKIEEITQKNIWESFDLISGTSTGGIISAGLTVSKDQTNPIYSVNDLMDLYQTKGMTIFPKRNAIQNKFLWYILPLFSRKGLDSTLLTFFESSKISDCIKPILISSYDLKNNRPLLFTSRHGNPKSTGYARTKNINLIDVTAATSAAPTYMSPHRFDYPDSDGNNLSKITCVDGGVFLNNPTLAAISEINMYHNDPIYNLTNLAETEIFILSLGTGVYRTDYSQKFTQFWGKLQWAKPISDLMMQATSQAVDTQTKHLIDIKGKNYLRANFIIKEKKYSNMADSSPELIKHLIEQTNVQLLNDSLFMTELTDFIFNANL